MDSWPQSVVSDMESKHTIMFYKENEIMKVESVMVK